MQRVKLRSRVGNAERDLQRLPEFHGFHIFEGDLLKRLRTLKLMLYCRGQLPRGMKLTTLGSDDVLKYPAFADRMVSWDSSIEFPGRSRIDSAFLRD